MLSWLVRGYDDDDPGVDTTDPLGATPSAVASAVPPTSEPDVASVPTSDVNLHRPVIGVLCLDSAGCHAGVTHEGAAGYLLAYVNTHLAAATLIAAREELQQSGIVTPTHHAWTCECLGRAVEALRCAHGSALVGIASDSLLALCCAEALVESCGSVPLLPSALLQSPLAMARIRPHETLLALVDVPAGSTPPSRAGRARSLGGGGAELTDELLDRGLCLPPHLRERLLVEAISGCTALPRLEAKPVESSVHALSPRANMVHGAAFSSAAEPAHAGPEVPDE